MLRHIIEMQIDHEGRPTDKEIQDAISYRRKMQEFLVPSQSDYSTAIIVEIRLSYIIQYSGKYRITIDPEATLESVNTALNNMCYPV